MEIYKLGTIECPECDEIDDIELLEPIRGKRKEEIGLVIVKEEPVFNYLFRCKECGTLFFVTDILE